MADVVVFLGPTGAGKSAQAARLAASRGWVHLSTGQLLRRDPVVAKLLGDGRLSPSAEVQRILQAAVDEIPAEQGIVLDGFPRTEDQAEWLDGFLAARSRRLARVIQIDIDEATSEQRLKLRGRSDDNILSQREKWREYESIMMVVAQYYEAGGLLTKIDGRGSMDEVETLIKGVLRS